MKDGDSVTEHLNAFNTEVSQFLSIVLIFFMKIGVSVYCALY
jgi:hypothetical protein